MPFGRCSCGLPSRKTCGRPNDEALVIVSGGRRSEKRGYGRLNSSPTHAAGLHPPFSRIGRNPIIRGKALRSRGPHQLIASAAMPARKSRILIADDNAQNVELMEAYLAGVDCDTAVAVDGAETLAKVAQFHPDLILLDIMM